MSHSVPASISPEGLTAFFHEQIPLTRAMGLRAIEASAHRLVLEAPLEPNRNHLGTAFGGSLHALPTLACYGAVWMTLRDAGLDGHVVVRRSAANYRRAVAGALRAVCERPTGAAVEHFLVELRRHRKAGMELTALVEGAAGKTAVEFNGSFVALL